VATIFVRARWAKEGLVGMAVATQSSKFKVGGAGQVCPRAGAVLGTEYQVLEY